MINLLPPDYKESVNYARRNKTLLNWAFALLISLAFIGVIIGAGYLFMKKSINDQSSQTAQADQQLQNDKIDETRVRLDEISSNTKLVLEVLSREVLFSQLLPQLGTVFPTGTSLESVNIEKVEGGISLSALARDIDSATQLQINLSDPKNKIFEKADIESITCSPDNSESDLPCSVQLRALFAKDTPYVYISNTSGQPKKEIAQ